MSANSVSPPLSGVTSMRSIDSEGGVSSLEMSECQPSPATRFDLWSAWITISSGGTAGSLTG